MSAERVKAGDVLENETEGEIATSVTADGRTAQPRYRRLLGVAREHRLFCAVLALAAVLRLIVMLGYPPAMFFNDSYSYLADVISFVPDNVRSDGYPFFLRALEPFHSFNLVTALQAVMGLLMGALIYAVLRRRGLPAWGATLCTLPVLFDVFEVQIEHTISSDVLFYTLVTTAVALLCLWDTPPWPAVIAVGLLVGYAATVRSVGEPMLAVFVVAMIARRTGWKRIVATVGTAAVPIAAYMVYFHHYTGKYALNESGAFLYARAQSFADCNRIKPPPNLAVLCDHESLMRRQMPENYPWDPNPLMTLTHSSNNQMEFTPPMSALATQFAEKAVEAQPLSYAKVVVKDTLTTFDWNRVDNNIPNGNVLGSGSMFQFEKTEPHELPWFIPSGYAGAVGAKDFGGADYGLTQVKSPWANFLWLYQHVYLRGPFLLVIILIGLAGVLLRLRREDWRKRAWGGIALLPFGVGAALIVVPPMTAGFSYRYVLAGVPALCLAAGLAFAGKGNVNSGDDPRTPDARPIASDRIGRALITWLKSRRPQKNPS